MYDNEKKEKAKYGENRKEYYTHLHDGEKCNHRRYEKWEYEKKERNEDRPEVEEDHRIVEMHRDTDMPHCHSCR